MIGYQLPAACLGYNNPHLLEAMKCPLSLQLFKEPVMLLGDGRTYEKDLIEKWMTDHNTSPITRERMITPKLIENRTLKDLIAELISNHPLCQFSDAQYLSPLAVVEFHNALLGYLPADKSLAISLKTRQQQLLSASHLKTKAKPHEILPFIRELVDNEPRLVIIQFESFHEKISAFQFACKHSSTDDIINFLFERIRRIYKMNKQICIGLLKGVLRGRFVGLVKIALSPPPDGSLVNEDYEIIRALGVSNNFMFLTAASALPREYIAKSIEYGATPTIKGKNGFSALMEAVVHMNSSAVPYLVEECKLPIKPAIPYAFMYRQDSILAYLLNKDFIGGIPTLHLLINKSLLEDWGRERMTDLIKKIMESKEIVDIHMSPHIDVLDYHHRSPLYCAVSNGYLDFVKILLNLGANPAVASPYTPLHAAAKLGDEQIMAELVNYLRSPLDINVVDVDGRSAFDIAAAEKHDNVVQLLINSTVCHLNVNFTKVKELSAEQPELAQSLLKKRLKSFTVGLKK
jgi:ankyrin repeat protein